MESLLALSCTTIGLPPSPSPLFASRALWLLRRQQSISSSITAAGSSSADSMRFSFPAIYRVHLRLPSKAIPLYARKRGSESEEPALEPSIVDELADDDDEDDLLLLDDDFDDEELLDDDFDEEYFEDEEAETRIGDGAAGGGISLAGTWWDKEALALAEEVSDSFDGQLKIYAFRTLANSTVQLRIENISTNMFDIEAFSKAYRELLDKAEQAKSVPDNMSLEVSSPGVERVVRIPQDLDRFKDRAMHVKYVSEVAASGSPSENVSEVAASGSPSESEGVFRLISFDLETNSCIWRLADVRINREKAGKGRPMSKKQREWRLSTSFDSLVLVRVYSEA